MCMAVGVYTHQHFLPRTVELGEEMLLHPDLFEAFAVSFVFPFAADCSVVGSRSYSLNPHPRIGNSHP